MTIRVPAEHRDEYVRLHRAVWPEVEHAMRREGMRNFTIFLHGETLVGYYEFVGGDHAAAQARIATDPASQRWWALTDPLQERLPDTPDGEQWAPLQEIWHLGDTAGTGVVDAHLHLWDPDVLPYPWLEGTTLRHRFDADAAIDAAPGVEEFVVVQADTAPQHAVAEVGWIASLFAGRTGLLGVVAHAPVEAGADVVSAQLDGLLAAGPVVGIRRLLHDEPDGFTAREGFRAGLRALGERGLPFDVCVRSHQLEEVADLVAALPDQAFVLDHLGKPAVGDPAAFAPWRAAMTRLAQHPGVVVKLSGLAGELLPGATLADARPYLETALEVFGPQRVLFASDWPILTQHTDNAAWWKVVEGAVAGLDDDARADVWGGNARRVYARNG